MKPMLASDWDESKVKVPVWVQPKIDGVRGLNINGRFSGRSLKLHKNVYTTEFYSQPCLAGLDGEVAAELETHPDLCRITSSKLRTIEGEPFTLWWVFDLITPATERMIYAQRYDALVERVEHLQAVNACRAASHLRVVPYAFCSDLAAVNDIHAFYSSRGYEGTILRDPYAYHKQGRSTVREGGLLRIKDFVDAEARVLRYEEGNRNDNEAQTNELGKTFRTTHQENMVPNGQVGTIIGIDLKTQKEIRVSPGNMPVADRIAEWNNRANAPGKLFTYKHFPKGVKDKPRFPTWKFWRDDADMS